MSKIRAHLASLEAWSTSVAGNPFRSFKLDEDTGTFKVAAGSVTGEVSAPAFLARGRHLPAPSRTPDHAVRGR